MTSVTHVETRVKSWANELIDLSRRNTSLFYKPLKRGTLQIVAPAPVQVLERLQRSQYWRFTRPATGDGQRPWTVEDSLHVASQDELVTERTTPADLDATLKNLARLAALDLADRGLESLYLTFGMLHWRRPDEDDENRSPLLFVPVQLVRNSPREPYRLVRLENDPVVNLSLRVLLEHEFDLTLPEFETGQTQDLDIGRLWEAVTSSVRSRGWRLEPTVTLKRATFHKEAMFKDLTENLELITAHPTVSVLASPEEVMPSKQEPPLETQLDELAPPERTKLILDADGSQRRAIVAAQQGLSFVMDGPPGTGKSQTIANMIAQLIADGKTVLFVSEKLAALEVVAGRLTERGLDPFLLELHGQKVGRREVADKLGEALRRKPVGHPRLTAADLARATRLRERLSGYTDALNRVRAPLMRSVAEIVGRLAQLSDIPAAPTPARVGTGLSADDVADLTDRFQQLGRVWSPVAARAGFVWRGLQVEHTSVGARPELQQLIDQLHRTLEQVEELSDQLADETALPAPRDLAAAERLVDVLEHCATQPMTERTWWSAPNLEDVTARTRELTDHQQAQRHDIGQLETAYGPGWARLDPRDATRVEQARHRLGRHDLVRPGPDPSTLDRQVGALRETVSLIEELREDSPYLAEALGAPARIRTIGEIFDLATVASHANDDVRPDAGWSPPAVIGRVEAAVHVLGPLVAHYQARRAALDEIFTPEVEQLDLTDLVVRFEQRHRGLRKLSGAYREDKRTVARVARIGKADKEVRAHLREAMEMQSAGRELDDAHDRAQRVLGTYAQSRQTDTDAAGHAIGVLRDALQLLRDDYNPEVIASQLGGEGPKDPRLADRGLRVAERIARWQQAYGSLLVGAALDRSNVEDLLEQVTSSLTAAEELRELVQQVADQRREPTDLATLYAELDRRAAVERRRDELRANAASDRRLFGELYAGSETDVEAVERGLQWVTELQSAHGGPLSERATTQLHARQPAADASFLRAVCVQSLKLRSALLDRFDAGRSEELSAELDEDLPQVRALLNDLADRMDQIEVWRLHVAFLDELKRDGWGPSLDYLLEERPPADLVPAILERALWTAWYNAIVYTETALSGVRADDLAADLREFRRLDHDLLEDAAQRVAADCAARRPVTSVGQAKIIEKESQKKSRHMPVRLLLDKTAGVTQALKPCFLMSPLSVSEFLPPTFHFDAIIFDEASQVTPADAINCVYRGTQLIVAGDDKQLPPTSFFDRAAIDDSDVYEEGQLDDFESVLGLCKGTAGMHSVPLQWHYRSQHEALIDFSNRAFYEGRLVTFPGASATGPSLGVSLEVVDAVYRAGTARDNPIEAAVVAERVLERAAAAPHESIGVVTFSQAQSEAVLNALDQFRLDRPEFDGFFATDGPDSFFVKALENVQGDERDIILFSVGYGPTEDGSLSANFGPLNKKGGERRLNVAVTRARRKVELFSSFQPEALAGRARAAGLVHLLNYMRYAREFSDGEREAHGVAEADRALAGEVADVVRGWGYEVDLGVGMSSYRVDVAVRDPREPGSYLLGIELDGYSHASAPVARDRERLRQEVLGRLGWPMHRVWGPAFHLDRAGSEARLRRAVEQAALGEIEQVGRRLGRVELAVEDVDLEATPRWARPYEPTYPQVNRSRHPGEPEAMSDLLAAVSKVVDAEAPITIDLLVARIATEYGVNATKRVRAAIERAVATLERRGAFTRVSNTLLGADPVHVRVPTIHPDSFREIDKIPPEELILAVTSLLRDAHSLSLDELVLALARLFGFKRTGARIRQAIEDATNELVDNGLVSQRRDGTLQVGEVELPDEAATDDSQQLYALIRHGESAHLEFKSTLRTSTTDGSVMKELEKIVAKTVAGFLNANGGTLLIGVADDGAIVGLGNDYRTLGKKGDRDGFELHLVQVLSRAIGRAALRLIQVSLHELDGHDVCRVDVRRSPEPVFLSDGQQSTFYARLGNATQPLMIDEAHRYIRTHWN
jgi:hypothetical protein